MDDGGSVEYYLIFNIFGEIWSFKFCMILLNLLWEDVFLWLTFFPYAFLLTNTYFMSTMCHTLQIVFFLTFLSFFRGGVWVGIGGSNYFSQDQTLGGRVARCPVGPSRGHTCFCLLARVHIHTLSSQLTLWILTFQSWEGQIQGEKKENYKTLSLPYLSTKLLRLCVFGGWKIGYVTFMPMNPFCNYHCGSPWRSKGRKI